MGILRNARCPNVSIELEKGAGAYATMPLPKMTYVIKEQSMWDDIADAQCTCNPKTVPASALGKVELDEQGFVTEVTPRLDIPDLWRGTQCGT